MADEKEKDNEDDETEEQEEEKDPVSVVDVANKAAERLEAANKETLKLIQRQEKMMVEKTLAGSTDASEPAMTTEEKGIAEAKKMLEGTGLEDHAFPDK